MHLKANKLKPLVIAVALAATSYSTVSHAEFGGSVTLSSDYLYNGVSQTDGKPALQLDLYRAHETGWYVGAFASNVDFGDDTWLEFDLYGGYEWTGPSGLIFELGALYYTYHGEDSSADYGEVTLAITDGAWRAQTWYAWDYAGTGAGHWIVGVQRQWEITRQISTTVGFDHSRSDDTNQWMWGSKSSYNHLWVRGDYDLENFTLFASMHITSLNNSAGGGNTFMAGVSWNF
ncbi:MAG: hypothetical protein JJU10_11825 [Idiomarina sp.]|nr:hypothetical protein [Idiomarina sp.]